MKNIKLNHIRDSKQIFSHTNHSEMIYPDIFVSGKGDKVNSNTDTYYDLTSGLWNVNYGYDSEYYKGIYEDQYSKLQYYPNCFWSTTDVTEKAADAITDHYSMSGVYFGTGGGDAIRAAIYISKFVNNKTEILSHKEAYHGSDNITTLCYNIATRVNEHTAAVIIEPVMTTNGVLEYPRDELIELERLRAKHGFLIIFDETVTGLGRTEINKSINPDIIIVSKGLTNGLFPLSATLVTDKIMHHIKTCNMEFDYGITMSGHPIGCALLMKSLELYTSTLDIRKKLEYDIVNKLKQVNFRNFGLLFGIEVPDAERAKFDLKQLGYIIHNYKNTLIFVPMFIADITNYQSFFDYLYNIKK